MKKLLLLTFLLGFLSWNAQAQSHQAGTFNIHAGGSIGAYATFLEHRFQGNKVDTDSSGAATILVPIEAHYGLLHVMSIGVYAKPGKYIDEDPNDPDIVLKKNSIFTGGVSLKLYPVNREKFNLYLGLGLGRTSLKQEKEQYIANVLFTQSNTNWSGSSIYGELGFNAYFGETVGMFFNLRYDRQKLKLNEYTLNNSSLNLTDNEFDLTAKGVNADIGIAFKF